MWWWTWLIQGATAASPVGPLEAAQAADAAHATHQGGLAIAGGGSVLLVVGGLWYGLEGVPQEIRGERVTGGLPFLYGGAAVIGLGMSVAAVAPAVGTVAVRRRGVRVTPVPGWLGVGLWGTGLGVAVAGALAPPDRRAELLLGGLGTTGVAAMLGAIQDDLNRDHADRAAGRTWTLSCMPAGGGVACRW